MQRRKPGKTRPVSFPAPVGGWISNRSLAIGRSPQLPPGAAVLDNWFPTATGILLRRGAQRQYDIGSGPVQSMFGYDSGAQRQLFAASGGDIFDISSDPAVIAYDAGTVDDWHTQQITTSGGTFLIGVNGTDPAWIYDGDDFSPLNVDFPSGSDLTTADISYVWLYASRLWFIQKNSMSAWYLPVDSIGGDLVEFPLVGSFEQGGALMWGHSWSLASGGSGGLSEQCVFTTTEGEVLAYQGQNPGEAIGFSKVGLYRIGRPLGARAFVRAGGDLLIATTVGMISLAEASRRDLAALGSSAISYPIEESWSEMIRERGADGWSCLIWSEGRMLVVAPPGGSVNDHVLFVANVNTGAWCRFTGWEVSSMATFNGLFRFGSDTGGIWIGNVTGADGDQLYTGTCIPLYDDLGAPASRKIARNGRVVKRSRVRATEKLTATFDFKSDAPSAPGVESGQHSAGFWDSGIWDQSRWGESIDPVVTSRWCSLGGSGQDVSVCVQVSSGDLVPIDAEVIRIDALFETARPIS